MNGYQSFGHIKYHGRREQYATETRITKQAATGAATGGLSPCAYSVYKRLLRRNDTPSLHRA